VRKDATLSLQGNRYQVEPHLAGRTLELYLDSTRLGLATVVTQNRQRHLAVERLATEPPDPPKPKSSLDYLAALRAEYQAQQQRELGPLQFSQLPLPEVDTPTDPTADTPEA